MEEQYKTLLCFSYKGAKNTICDICFMKYKNKYKCIFFASNF